MGEITGACASRWEGPRREGLVAQAQGGGRGRDRWAARRARPSLASGTENGHQPGLVGKESGKEGGSASLLPQLGLGSPAEAELAGAGGTRIF